MAFHHEIQVWHAHQAIEDGHYKEVVPSLTSDGVAQPSVKALNEMLAKHSHTSATPTLTPTDPVPAPLQFALDVIVRALRSFLNGTAPGPSSLSANHLKESVFFPLQGYATYAVHKLCNFIIVLSSAELLNIL